MRKVVNEFCRNYGIQPNRDTKRKIGIELEFPVVDDNGKAVDYSLIKELFFWLGNQGWQVKRDEETGEEVSAEKEVTHSSGRFGFSKDVIKTDMGYCTIEVSLTPEDNLFLIAEHWQCIKLMLLDYFHDKRCHVLGYGIQPISLPNKSYLAKKGRYIFFEQDSLNRFVDQKYGCDFHIHALSAANQCHIDIYQGEAIKAVNVFNCLAPLFSAITANASVWKGAADPEWMDIREIFWDMALSNRTEQIGIPEPFMDFTDYVDRLCQFRPFIIKKGSEYIKILGSANFGEYLRKRKSPGQMVDGRNVVIQSSTKDIHFQGTIAWWDARLSSAHGTLEIRPCSQQPENAILSIAALALGLVENLSEAKILNDQFAFSSWCKLRFDALRHGLQATIEDTPVGALVAHALQIARVGLKKRGLGEEIFLQPLEERLEKGKTLAEEVQEVFDPTDLTRFFDLVEIRR